MFGTATYTYDQLDNLTRAKLSGGDKVRDHYYCYSNNRLSNIKTGSCAGSTVIGLEYDVQGNLANKSAQTYSFDYGNRLREVPGKEWYAYDGHGRRVLSCNTSNCDYQQYANDGKLYFHRDNRASKYYFNIYLGGSLVAIRELPTASGSTETVRYQHTDALGTPIATTDASKNYMDTFEYEPYGQLVNGTLKDGPGYTGHVQDAATGLTYMQQRYMDPALGVFLSTDPVTAYSNPVGQFHRYRYANNNPYRFTDPDGRESACFSTGHGCGLAAGSALFAGRQAVDAGAERSRYSSEAQKLDSKDSAGRSALKAESRERTPSVVRAAVEAARPSTGPKPGSGGTANASNAGANAVGESLKVGGRVLIAAAVVQQAGEIANSPEPARDVAGAGGLTLGAIGGGEGAAYLGGAIGSFIAPGLGTAIGAGVGGLVGSAVGGHYGEKSAEAVYDKTREQ